MWELLTGPSQAELKPTGDTFSNWNQAYRALWDQVNHKLRAVRSSYQDQGDRHSFYQVDVFAANGRTITFVAALESFDE